MRDVASDAFRPHEHEAVFCNDATNRKPPTDMQSTFRAMQHCEASRAIPDAVLSPHQELFETTVPHTMMFTEMFAHGNECVCVFPRARLEQPL